MATVNKDFKVKNGLIVEGTTGTINNYDILTKKPDDQTYIIGLIGGAATDAATPNTVVLRDANADFAANMITADLTGDVTGTVSDISNHSTTDLAEGTNLYFTDERAQDAVGDMFTGNTETGITVTYDDGTNKVNFSVDDQFPSHSTTDLAEGTNKYYTDQRVDDYINNYIDTDDVSEGTTNLYYTDTRVRGAVDSGDGLNYNSATGVFTAHLGNGLEIGVGGAIQIDDLVVATETDLTNAINNHDVTTGVHGVSGDIVGTTDTQTISNKTLGSNLDADGYQIIGLGTPMNSTDAATKGYVDAVSEGLHVHEAARVYVGTNINLSTQLEAGDIIDGVTLVAGDRVLVNGQSTQSQNGIYVVQASGSAVRATDFDTALEIASGDFIFVSAGTNYGQTGWVQTLSPATIGNDPISFTQFSGAGTYTAGNGLSLDGTVFEIDETITATHTYVATEIDTHSDLTTGVHGVTGTVVGTSDSQTLTNKTLGASTVLGANLDASSYKITNLEDPTSNQDAATKFYVDGEVSTVSGDLTTHAGLTTGTHGVTGTIVGTSDTQTLTNKTIDGNNNTLSNIGNGSLSNSSVTINGNSLSLGGSLTLDTDDVSEGTTNQYFTDVRAVDALTSPLTTGTQTNITVTYNNVSGKFDFVAENGVADSTTDDLDEGTTNLYFTDARAVSALEAVVPNFTEIDINSVATQVAATTAVATASTVTAYQFPHADYRSAKFLVKAETGSHTEVSEVLVTLDSTNNIAITEYAIVGTNGNLVDVSADIDAANVRLRVTTINNSTDVTVVGTLIA